MSSPKKNVAYTFYISLVDSGDTGTFKVNPTIAAGDFKVSIDGGSFNNLATLPVVTPAGSVAVLVSLSASEMNGDKIVAQCIDAAGGEWDDVLMFIDATTANVDDLVQSVTPANKLNVDGNNRAKADAEVLGPAASQDIAREAHDVSGTIWHVKYDASETMGNDALSWATADETAGVGVKTDIEAAAAGDLVALGVGAFALGANGITGPTNVDIDGAGMDQTVLSSTVTPAAILLPGAGSKISNLTVKGLLTDGSFQYPIVLNYDGILCEDVHVIGDADGFFGTALASTSRVRLRRCYADTKFDALRIADGTWEIEDGKFVAIGPSLASDNIARAMTITGTGTHFLKNSLLHARNGGGTTAGVVVYDTARVYIFGGSTIAADDTGNFTTTGLQGLGGDIFMFGGSIRTANGDDTDMAVVNSGSGKVVLVGVDYDRAKVSNTGAGEILDISSPEEAIKLFNLDDVATDLADGGRLDLLIDAIKAKTDLYPYAIQPFTSSSTATGRIDPTYLTAYQDSRLQAMVPVNDASGNPVNLSGKTLKLVAWTQGDLTATVFELTTEGGSPGLTVGGDDNNEVSIDANATNFTAAGQLDYRIYDMTNDPNISPVIDGVIEVVAGRAPA